MVELMSLEDDSLVSEAFIQEEKELTEDDLRPYLRRTGIEADLDPLHEKIRSDVFNEEDYGPGDSEIDGEVAETVRRTLDLTRREAAMPGIWHYLTVIHFEEFVRYRWQSKLREKFLKGGQDIYSNALHRLWWIAEITSDGDDYSRTEEIFEMQELANDVADSWFARYKPVTYACVDELNIEEIDELEPPNSTIVSKTTVRLREELSVVVAESLGLEEARALIADLRAAVVEEEA
jgi:hypothetical protein